MKKLLSTFLLCFCFSANAQNSQTIQQLLDEGVTIGELLDSGITSEEFYGLEYEGGYIFDIDTISGTGKVAFKTNEQRAFQCYNDPNNDAFDMVATTDSSGYENTLNVSSVCSEGYNTGANYALNFISAEGYDDWYLPTRTDLRAIHNAMRQVWVTNSNYYMTSESPTPSEYWRGQFMSSMNFSNDVIDWSATWKGTSGHLILVRDFDVYNVSITNYISLNEYEHVQQILELGYLPNEVYGLEYEGGYIFDIDTISGTGKVAFKTNEQRAFQCYNDPNNDAFDMVATTDSSGYENTLNVSSVCSEGYNTGANYALNFISAEGYDDWYLPTRTDLRAIHNAMRQVWVTNSNYYMTSESPTPSEYWRGQFMSSMNFSNDVIDWSATWKGTSGHLILVRDFDLNTPSIPELSTALESFLETYTPPEVEEEVVSDANSFDVLNPLSYNGEFESVHFELTTDFNYEVPSGKTLLINQSYSYQNPMVYINNIYVTVFDASNSSDRGSQKVLTLSSGDILSLTASNSNAKVYVHGLLINKVIPTIHFELTTNSNYEVPSGKTLIINQSFSYQNPTVYINDIKVATFDATTSTNRVLQQMLVSGSGDILSLTASNPNAKVYVHGILVNNSNYTYASDYELIDALNEGMDSLSTMSEVVVLENDSISSQNAILSQENEALMAIDYNFDSLQYVADFLSSQVFELQQELLVPNIDVDMAIGWNMVGFSCPQQKTAEDALLSIVDEIIIFKDNSGNVYMPEFSFNGIGDLTPGHGYQLKVTDYILDFNICE